MRRPLFWLHQLQWHLLNCTAAYAQQGDGTEVQITTNVFKPNKVAPTSDRIGQLKLPDGFTVQRFAQGLGNSRIIPSPTRASSTSAVGKRATCFS